MWKWWPALRGEMMRISLMVLASAALLPGWSLASGEPDRLVFTTGAKNIAARRCSSAVTVQTRDDAGIPADIDAGSFDGGAGTVALLTSQQAYTGFFSDPSCAVPI